MRVRRHGVFSLVISGLAVGAGMLVAPVAVAEGGPAAPSPVVQGMSDKCPECMHGKCQQCMKGKCKQCAKQCVQGKCRQCMSAMAGMPDQMGDTLHMQAR